MTVSTPLTLTQLREMAANPVDGPTTRSILRNTDRDLRSKRLMRMTKPQLLDLVAAAGVSPFPVSWAKPQIVAELLSLLDAYQEDLGAVVLTRLHRAYAGQVLGAWEPFGPGTPLYDFVIEQELAKIQALATERGYSTAWVVKTVAAIDADPDAAAEVFAGLVNPAFDVTIGHSEPGKPWAHRYFGDNGTQVQLCVTAGGKVLLVQLVETGKQRTASDGRMWPIHKVAAYRFLPTVDDGVDTISELRSLDRERKMAETREVWEEALDEDERRILSRGDDEPPF